MRRISLIASLVLASLGLPAEAGSRVNQPEDVTWGAAVPCAVACANWTDTLNTDVDGDGNAELYFQVCAAPSPPFSYRDIRIFAPPGAHALEVWIFPEVDWDLFVCSLSGEHLGTAACPLSACTCKVDLPLQAGCAEHAMIRVEPTRGYILRAYSWSDPFRLSGWYAFWSRDALEG